MSALAISSGAEEVAGVGVVRVPPLLGDAHGRHRVHFVGNSGTFRRCLERLRAQANISRRRHGQGAFPSACAGVTLIPMHC